MDEIMQEMDRVNAPSYMNFRLMAATLKKYEQRHNEHIRRRQKVNERLLRYEDLVWKCETCFPEYKRLETPKQIASSGSSGTCASSTQNSCSQMEHWLCSRWMAL